MKKLAFAMVLILLMSLMVVPVYAAPATDPERSPSRDDEVIIDEDDTPLAENPDDEVDIDDSDIPLVSSPQTGEGSMDVVLAAAAVLCMAGVATVAVSKKKAAA